MLVVTKVHRLLIWRHKENIRWWKFYQMVHSLPWLPGCSLPCLPCSHCPWPLGTSEASSSLGVSVRLRAIVPLLPLVPSTLTRQGPLGSQAALETFSNLGASVRLRGLGPLAPCPLITSHSLCEVALEAFGSLGTSIRLSPYPWAPWGLNQHWGPLVALGVSVRHRCLAPLVPPHP